MATTDTSFLSVSRHSNASISLLLSASRLRGSLRTHQLKIKLVKAEKRLQFGPAFSGIIVSLFVFHLSFSRPHQKNLFSLFLHTNNETNSVSIKGPLDGDAVLCTREATFDLKTVETTNSLLLVPEGEVRSFCPSFLFPHACLSSSPSASLSLSC